MLHGEKEKGEAEPSFLLQRYPQVLLKKVPCLKRSLNPLIDLLAFFQILTEIFKFKADIVHTHGSKPGVLGRLAARICRTPVIIHTFHGHFFHSYFSKSISRLIAAVERAIGKITTCAIALSASQKEELVNKYKVLPSSKIKIIPLGFAFNSDKDPQFYRENFRKKYNLQHNDIGVGIVGRIVPVKNHSFFIKVVHQLLSRKTANPPAFFIIGDGDLRTRVEKELRLKKIAYSHNEVTSTERVVFTSWLTNLQEIMNGLDVIVLTSLNEGTPLSIIEAQFFGKPVVATNVGGVKDSLEDGLTGFLVEGNDEITFCKKLELLINDGELRKTMGEEGKKFVAQKFSKEKEIAEMKSLYFSLMNKKGYTAN
jgi:glycosyltransferase involved in cell wall biosynthesis